MHSFIWLFTTCAGSVRLQIAVDDDTAPLLFEQLRGLAEDAASLESFVAASADAIGRAGGILAELMRQPWPQPTLSDGIRQAATCASVLDAAEVLLAAVDAAREHERHALLYDDRYADARAYIASVLGALDDAGTNVASRLATACGVSDADLAQVLAVAH